MSRTARKFGVMKYKDLNERCIADSKAARVSLHCCPYCPMSFKVEADFKAHWKTVHVKVKQ